ncbi:hypothetical protein BHE74_00036615, partial [Ensete ventricosum]
LRLARLPAHGCVSSAAGTRPPLDAIAVNRLWQTRVRPPLDAAAAYARLIGPSVA